MVALLSFGTIRSGQPAVGQEAETRGNQPAAQPRIGAAQEQPPQRRRPRQQQAQQAQQIRQARQARLAAGARTNADFLAALLNAADEGGADVLSVGDSYDDFASIARTSDGTVWAAHAAYYDGHDQIRLRRRLADGRWATHTYVPLLGARPDIWMPQLAVDAADRLWVVWCEQTGQTAERSGNWDLYARPLVRDEDGERWGETVRLTTDPKPDINPHVATDRQGNIHVVWQAHPENSGDVQYCRFDGREWSKPLAVTSDEESDWYPHVAVDQGGTAWIAFDSYRNGDYDVFLTSVASDGTLGQVIPIATSTFYEAHASVACTPDGKVWVAWEQGGHNWGKDQGYWLRQGRNQGTTLGSTRAVKVAAFEDGEVWAAPDVAASLDEGERQPSAHAELAAGEDGRLWLRFRHLVRGRQRPQGGFTRGWAEYVTHLTDRGWAAATSLPASHGRISVFSRILPDSDGALWIAYSGDARSVDNFHRPIHDTVLVARLPKPDGEPGTPPLVRYHPPAPPAAIPAWNAAREQQQVQAIRSHRVTIDGRPHQIVRGDLHRHTELSWDVGPGNDGSYLDFYRYMIDVAAMDFGSLTDHQGGGHYAYWWWLTEKSCDMYYLPPRYVPLYGYERSARFPDGHRNIFHAYRGVPVFPFRLNTDQTGVFPGVGTGALFEDDTKLLYRYLHGTRGLAISHTSGTDSMGTDWRDNDPEIEPVVEIYQGARNSYEALGGPRVHPEDEPPARAPGGFQKEGLVWNAYAKGYRLGTIASSDHGSTHISYALVYTPENDRQAILDSIRKRHTYGGTDNLIVAVTSGEHFMGDEFASDQKPSLSIRVTGTAKIAQLDIVRNNEYVYTSQPGEATIDMNYTDMTPAAGTNLYYVRLLQEDGEVAWSSPLWVNYK
ncbi:MAG TPA: hypothetical protein VML55_10625 [Planctomycetaceae bacterium]|nr:hypothetical protein [Planctomycetaceae bacterium]